MGINKKFDSERGSLFIKLEELSKNYMQDLKLRGNEEVIFSAVFLIGNEV